MRRRHKRLTDAQVQEKLDLIASLSNELEAEAKARWGKEALLFAEADGRLHLMSEDNDKPGRRQEGVRFSASVSHSFDVGAW